MSHWFVLEGPDGCGKSTQARALCDWLGEQGRDALHLREPGSTPVGEALRSLLLDPATGALGPETEALLFTAARAELVPRVVAPALARGRVVVSERCWVSTLVYQGYAAGVDLDWIEDLTARAHQGTMPAVVFVLDLPPEEAARRMGGRTRDRFEERSGEWLARVHEGFRQVTRRDDRIRIVDGARPAEEVQAGVRRLVAEALR